MEFNQEVHKYNYELAKLMEKFKNVSIIKSDNIHGGKFDLHAHDKIHFNQKGKIALVRALKLHLNPEIGLKPIQATARIRTILVHVDLTTSQNGNLWALRARIPTETPKENSVNLYKDLHN